jgi:hypothetical protein
MFIIELFKVLYEIVKDFFGLFAFFPLSYLLYAQTRQLHLPSELVYSCQDVVIILNAKKHFWTKRVRKQRQMSGKIE